jgi:hypothetical protein
MCRYLQRQSRLSKCIAAGKIYTDRFYNVFLGSSKYGININYPDNIEFGSFVGFSARLHGYGKKDTFVEMENSQETVA